MKISDFLLLCEVVLIWIVLTFFAHLSALAWTLVVVIVAAWLVVKNSEDEE